MSGVALIGLNPYGYQEFQEDSNGGVSSTVSEVGRQSFSARCGMPEKCSFYLTRTVGILVGLGASAGFTYAGVQILAGNYFGNVFAAGGCFVLGAIPPGLIVLSCITSNNPGMGEYVANGV